MPYIKNDDGRREALQKGDTALIAGELNYQIFYYIKHIDDREPLFFNDENNLTKIKEQIRIYVKNFLGEKPNYQKYNDMTGALIRCYIEIKRRLNVEVDLLIEICASYDNEIAKYEQKKCEENGDVD